MTDKTNAKRKNLVIVPAGDQSLHTRWIKPDRSFDVWTIYYGNNIEQAKRFEAVSDRLFTCKGLKIELARIVLLPIFFLPEIAILQAYDYFWFPDDDLDFPVGSGSVDQLFETAHNLQADIFQPAVENENISGLWEPTKKIPGAFCHRTNLVEIMAPGFSQEAFFHAFLPAVYTMNFMQAGWGLEPIWTRIGESQLRRPFRNYVIDSCPILHTRPVGSGSNEVRKRGDRESMFIPQIKTDRVETLAVFSSLEEALAEGAREAA